MLASYSHCFNSMPIDVFFDEAFGPLPYRSIRFHSRDESLNYHIGSSSVVNYTDNSPLTRQTDWSRLPFHRVRQSVTKVITQEEPCDYRENSFERYYPIKTSDGRYDVIYQKYKELSAKYERLSFIGRCGTYQYLDMHQVINQSLQGVHLWIDQHR
jgi:UDP-galactopyranose mutase